jgi:phage gpG-like protein
MATDPSGSGGIYKNAAMIRFERAFSDPVPALRAIGAAMVAESQDAFQQQKFGEEEWEPRAAPNVMGIIADFALGRKEPLARRFERRPALMDTGRLRQSIAFRVTDNKALEVGTTLDYASALHYGGEVESEIITQEMQESLWDWLSKSGAAHKKQLGFLLNKKQVGKPITTTVPARTLVGVSDQTVDDIREIIGAIAQGKAYYEGNGDG